MAAVTVTTERAIAAPGRAVIRYSGTGAANTDATLTTTAVAKHHSQRLCYVSVSYNGAVTQTGVTIGIDSALGSAFDLTITTGTANAQFTVYVPSTDIHILPGDAWTVTALAGGSGDIASLQVTTEEV